MNAADSQPLSPPIRHRSDKTVGELRDPAVLLAIAFFLFVPRQILLAEQPERPVPVRSDSYGDPLPKGVRFRLGSVRFRHDAAVTALAWLPDGHTLVSAGADYTVRHWQIPGGKQLAKWDNMPCTAFSLDGRILACKGKDGAIRIIDSAAGKELCQIRAPKNSNPGAISADGKFLAAIEWKKGLHLLAVDSGKELGFLEGKVLPSWDPLLFSPDSRSVIVKTENGVYRWSIDTGAKSKILIDNKSFPVVHSIVFSPDGKTLAAVLGDGASNIVSLRSWPAGKELQRLQAEDYALTALAFSRDGKLLAGGGLGCLRLWELATGKELRRFEGLEGEIIDVAFSPDGSLLASASNDGGITVREVEAKRVPRPLTGLSHRIAAIAATADSRRLLTHACDGALTLWDGRDGRRLRTVAHWDGSAIAFRLAPDGSRLLVLPWFDSTLWWDVAGGRSLPAFSGISERASCGDFSPDSALLALGGFDGLVHLRATAQGSEVRCLKDKETDKVVCDLAFAPDGRTLAVSHTDGKLTLWDLKTGRPRHRIAGPGRKHTWKLLFSSDSRLLAVVWEDAHAIHLFETLSGQEIRQVRIHPAEIGSLAFAPDNRTLAVGDKDPLDGVTVPEHSINLWDSLTGKQIQHLRGHQGAIHTLIFCPDGASLLSGSDDRTVLCWDTTDVIHRRPASKELSAVRLAELWADLAAPDAARAQQAVAELIQAPHATVPFLEKSLPPLLPPDRVRIAAWIDDLDHEEFARRERASEELAKLGEPAAPALRWALQQKPSLEMRRRIDALLEALDARPISPDRLRTIRTLQVLETIGTPQARRVLEGLAQGAADAMPTLAAKAALLRLDRRNAQSTPPKR